MPHCGLSSKTDEQHYKPGSVSDNHLSRPSVTVRFKRPTRNTAGNCIVPVWSCFKWGLHSLSCYQGSGKLLPYLFTLTCIQAVIFCCTSLRVTSTGRYPASCPAKPGLSSSVCLNRIQPRLPVLLTTRIF